MLSEKKGELAWPSKAFWRRPCVFAEKVVVRQRVQSHLTGVNSHLIVNKGFFYCGSFCFVAFFTFLISFADKYIIILQYFISSRRARHDFIPSSDFERESR